MHYGDVIVLWNNDPAVTERDALTQESRLRTTVEGQRFAYAHRNDALRRRAFQKLSTAYPEKNTKSTWNDYFGFIAKGLIPYPDGVKLFRPTIDWALTLDRFSFFLELRTTRRKEKALNAAAVETTGVSN